MKSILFNFLRKLGIEKKYINSYYPLQINKLRAAYYRFKMKKLGWGSTIENYTIINNSFNVSIGEFTAIGSHINIWAGDSGLTIGDRVLIASHVTITTLTHDYTNANMRFIPAIDKPIFIGDDVWIGSHAVIMPGVTIAKGAVIGAGSVVTHDVEENAIMVGIPAKFLKYRNI